MGSEFEIKHYIMGDLVEVSQGLAINAKSKFMLADKGLPLLRITDLINDNQVQFINPDHAPEKCLATENDIIYTRTGQVGLVFKGKVGVIHNNCFKVIPNTDLIDPDFLYWFLSQNNVKYYVNSVAAGSVQKDLNHSAFKSIPISLPALKHQKAVIPVLDVITKKIQLNRQTNQTLEAMAQALFKSWFVDFDPVFDNAIAHNLAHNNAPLHNIPEPLLPHAQRRLNVHNEGQHNADNVERGSARQTTAAHAFHHLFPQTFEQSDEPSVGIQGWVPKGWGVKNMNELADTISNTYPLKTVDKVIFLNTGDIEAGNFLHRHYSEPSTLPGQAKKMIQKDDILYSEIRPKNKRFAYVYFDGTEHVVSTKLMVLRAKEKANSRFVYFLLTLDKTIFDLQRIAELRSGTFPQITYTELSLIKAAIPSDGKVLKAFSDVMLNTYYNKNLHIQAENENLESLRDTLLPKLISGELRIPDAQKSVEVFVK